MNTIGRKKAVKARREVEEEEQDERENSENEEDDYEIDDNEKGEEDADEENEENEDEEYDDDDDDDSGDGGSAGKADGMADMMSRILGQQVGAKIPVLAKRKTAIMKEMEEDRGDKDRLKRLRVQRKAEKEKQLVVPDLSSADYEKQLRKLATRGVVALFNAISKANKERLDAEASEVKKGPVEVSRIDVKKLSQTNFLEMLKGSSAATVGQTNSSSSSSSSSSSKSRNKDNSSELNPGTEHIDGNRSCEEEEAEEGVAGWQGDENEEEVSQEVLKTQGGGGGSSGWAALNDSLVFDKKSHAHPLRGWDRADDSDDSDEGDEGALKMKPSGNGANKSKADPKNASRRERGNASASKKKNK